MKTLPEGLVASTISSLGIDVIESRGGELIALCPGHKMLIGKEDHSPSWSINERSGVHYCFSCGFRGNLYTLVRDLDSKKTADNMLREYEEMGRVVTAKPGDRLRITDKPRGAFGGRKTKELSESALTVFDLPPDWALERRRIHAVTAKTFGIRWDSDAGTWILPLRYPEDDRLMGYQVKAERGRFFRNRPVSMPKSETLFGLDAMKDQSSVVVVESPLDAVLLEDMGYPAVAICGSKVSETQINLLGKHFDVAYFWLDNDAAGEKETQRLRKMQMQCSARIEFVAHTEGYKDPGEMPYGLIDQTLSDVGF